MKQNYKSKLLTTTLIAMLVFSLFSTVTVFADDSTPPPTDTPATEEAPPVEDAPPAVEEIPAQVEAPVEESPAPEAIAAEPPAEDLSVALENLPEDSGLLVLDKNGEALPLASNEVAQIVSSADPYFWDGTKYVGFTTGVCPAIVAAGNCTVVSSNPITAAVTAFAGSATASGAIYVEAGTYNENVTVNSVNNLTGLIGAGSGSTTINGNVNVSNMNAFTFQGFTLNGGFSATNNSGTLALNDLVVSNPSGNGINVTGHSGNVTLNDINAHDSDADGAHIEADGSVTMTGTNEFMDNRLDGLDITANGDISLHDITATGNGCGDCSQGDGVRLNNNNQIPTNINITGTNNISDNTFDGLYAASNGNIAIENLNANGNGDPLDNANGSGAYLIAGGNVILTGTNVFHDNTDFGLYINTQPGNVVINNITAYNNTTGVQIDPMNITINCGDVYDNGVGLDATYAGTLTLNAVTIQNNKTNSIFSGSAPVQNTSCAPPPVITPPPTNSSAPVSTSSNSGSGCPPPVILEMPNGDKVIFYCMTLGQAAATQNGNPPDLGSQQGTLISGLTAGETENGAPKPLATIIKVSFVIPEDMQDANLAILYWNGSEWVEIEGVNTGDGHFETTVNFTGIFVLVKK